MARVAAILLASGMLAPILNLGCVERALALAPPPSQAAPVATPSLPAIAGRAHLIFKAAAAAAPMEGKVTVLEQPDGLVVLTQFDGDPRRETADPQAADPDCLNVSAAGTHHSADRPAKAY